LNVTITTTSGTAASVLAFCQNPSIAIAIGNGNWTFPDLPPRPQLYWQQLPNLIGYIWPYRIVPIIRDPNGDIPQDLDTKWRSVELRASVLADLGVDSVLVEARLNHDLLPPLVTDYQSAAIYLNARPSDRQFTSGSPLGVLDTIQHFGNIERSLDTTHVIRIIRKF
jgi:hypothetical protein